MGMCESIRINGDLVQHLLNIGSRKRMPYRGSQGFQLDLRSVDRFASACLAEGPGAPIHPPGFFPVGQPTNFIHFLVRKKDLKALTHAMSMTYSNEDHTQSRIEPAVSASCQRKLEPVPRLV